MKRKIRSLKRSFFALLLLPVCWGLAIGMWTSLKDLTHIPDGCGYFLAGVGGYFILQWVFFTPIRTYVFGHEMTHALAAWASGGKVRHFHVSKKGGSITVTKSNTFVALAPYVVPVYAVGLMAAFYGAGWFYDLHRYWPHFLTALGATLGFHLALTFFALRQRQPDLKTAGTFLSAVLIFMGNALLVTGILAVLFPQTVSYRLFLTTSGREAGVAMTRASHGLWQGWLQYVRPRLISKQDRPSASFTDAI